MTFNRKMFISNRQAVAHDMCQGLRDMSSRIVCLLLYKILKSQITHKKDPTIPTLFQWRYRDKIMRVSNFKWLDVQFWEEIL